MDIENTNFFPVQKCYAVSNHRHTLPFSEKGLYSNRVHQMMTLDVDSRALSMKQASESSIWIFTSECWGLKEHVRRSEDLEGLFNWPFIRGSYMHQYYTIIKMHLQGIEGFFLIDHQGEDKDSWMEKMCEEIRSLYILGTSTSSHSWGRNACCADYISVPLVYQGSKCT